MTSSLITELVQSRVFAGLRLFTVFSVYGDCPMFRRFYVQKVLCSEHICSKGSMFRRFYIQKVLCSEGPMFRRSYIQKVLRGGGEVYLWSEMVGLAVGPYRHSCHG